jgi:hypothetical protein
MLYLGGYKSGLMMMLSSWGGGGIGSDALMSSLIISLVAGFGVSLLAGVASRAIAGNYSVMFTIPAAFITTFMGSFMLLPISFIFEPTMPIEISYFLGGFLYITLIATIISFIRGGDF